MDRKLDLSIVVSSVVQLIFPLATWLNFFAINSTLPIPLRTRSVLFPFNCVPNGRTNLFFKRLFSWKSYTTVVHLHQSTNYRMWPTSSHGKRYSTISLFCCCCYCHKQTTDKRYLVFTKKNVCDSIYDAK